MGKNKKIPKKRVGVRDLSAKSGASVGGGRQTPKTDFGAVLGQGNTKPTDTTSTTT